MLEKADTKKRNDLYQPLISMVIKIIIFLSAK